MPSEKSVSFRTHLVGNITDLIGEIGLQCALTAKLAAGVASQLAAYTEEGIRLAPTVFICNSISKLLQRAGVGEYIPLSDTEPTGQVALKVLKVAAPLCTRSWRIYIERSPNGESCRFGVFCGSSDPSSLTVDEVVMNEFESGFPIIRIAQSAINKVEVRTNAGSGIEFRFNDDIDIDLQSQNGHILRLSNIIAKIPGLSLNFSVVSSIV